MTIRDESPRCPRCRIELVVRGPAHGCEQCGGAWLAEDRVAAMIAEMKDETEAATLDFVPCPADPLPCPECGAAMQPVMLEDVGVDRCRHGMWFDADELEDALFRASGGDDDKNVLPSRTWWGRLLLALAKVIGFMAPPSQRANRRGGGTAGYIPRSKRFRR